MRLNRTAILKSVNESLSERGSNLRVRYSVEWQEYTVKSPNSDSYHSNSLIDAIETANSIRVTYGY